MSRNPLVLAICNLAAALLETLFVLLLYIKLENFHLERECASRTTFVLAACDFVAAALWKCSSRTTLVL